MPKTLTAILILLVVVVVGLGIYGAVRDSQVTSGVVVATGYQEPYTTTTYVRVNDISIPTTQYHEGYFYIDVYSDEQDWTRRVPITPYMVSDYKVGTEWEQ